MKRAFSAGGIVYKIEDGNVKILLISTKDGKVWALPKGLVEKRRPKRNCLKRNKRRNRG